MSKIVGALRRLLATKRGRLTALGGIVALVVIIAVASTAGSGGSESNNQQDQGTSTETAEEQEARRKGFHCLSEWDGHHDGMNELIKAELNDPSSLDVHTTSIGPETGGFHQLKVDFSARNAFGGMVRHVASGIVDHETCEAGLIGID